jgi:hypothetical protein
MLGSTDHDARDGAEEDGVRAEVAREVIAACQELPGLDSEAHDGRDVTASADVLRRSSETPLPDAGEEN